jgi:hypothetical protein
MYEVHGERRIIVTGIELDDRIHLGKTGTTREDSGYPDRQPLLGYSAGTSPVDVTEKPLETSAIAAYQSLPD